MKNELQRRADLLSSEAYDPKALIAHVKKALGIKKDSDLVKLVGFNASVISKVRHKRKLLSAELLLAFHDLTGLSVQEMRWVMGDRERYDYRENLKSGDIVANDALSNK
jgi:hypothetical protein